MSLEWFIALLVFGGITFLMVFSGLIFMIKSKEKNENNFMAKIVILWILIYILISIGFIFKFGLQNIKIQ